MSVNTLFCPIVKLLRAMFPVALLATGCHFYRVASSSRLFCMAFWGTMAACVFNYASLLAVRGMLSFSAGIGIAPAVLLPTEFGPS